MDIALYFQFTIITFHLYEFDIRSIGFEKGQFVNFTS